MNLTELLRGGGIKSIQRVNITVGTLGVTSATIAAVDPATTIVLGQAFDHRGSLFLAAAPVLTNATTLSASTGLGSGENPSWTITLTAIDLGGAVKSVQRGSRTGAGGAVTIATVDPAKSIVLIDYAARSSSPDIVTGNSNYSLAANALTLPTYASNVQAHWQVVEFN